MNNYRQTSIKKNLELRALIIQAVRKFFIDNKYLEIETPYRIPAPAPEAHIDAEVSGNWYLHTSPELCMKRLLASGYPRIFQICRCFRQKERGARHLPELTMLEWYTANHNYFEMMDQCEELIIFISHSLGFGDILVYQGNEIDLKAPWLRMSVADAFDRFASVSMKKALREKRFDEVMVRDIEPNLEHNKPLFLFDYPAECSSLARMKPGDRSVAERFELYISSLELCNAFTELTNSIEQRKRFEHEQKLRSEFGKTTYPLPEKFLESLKFMPEASGNALGLDRLVMLFADTPVIDDVVAFTPEEL
jgi:lysyl-tRNA synthetase class 2